MVLSSQSKLILSVLILLGAFIGHTEAQTPHKKYVPNWTLLKEGKNYFAQEKKWKLKIRLLNNKTPPKIVRWMPRADKRAGQVGLLIYSAGKSNKAPHPYVRRAVLIHTGKKRKLGDAPFEYRASNPQQLLLSPRWEWKKNRLKVSDPTYQEKISFVLD